MFTIVVDEPAIYGKIPQTPQPIRPKKKLLLLSFLIIWKFFVKYLKLRINKIRKKINHLQNDREIGGTSSTPPLATIRLLAMKSGWNTNRKYPIILLFIFI